MPTKVLVAAHCPATNAPTSAAIRRSFGLHCQLVRTASGLAAHPGMLSGRDDAFHPGYRLQLPAQVRQNLLPDARRSAFGFNSTKNRPSPRLVMPSHRISETTWATSGERAEHLLNPALQCDHRREGNVLACSRRDHDLPDVLLREKTLRE